MLWGSILLAVLAVAESSCHKRQVLIPTSPPAPVPSAPAEAAPAVAKPAPQEIPAPPALAPAAPAPGAESAIPNQPAAPPPAPARTTRRPSRQAPAPAAPAAAQPAPNAAPAPQLAIVLTPDQQRQYNADVDQSLQRAEASLKSIGNRQLTEQQQASLDEVRNFIRQAQATRASDLPGARRLAERAEVLAGNLANTLH